MSSPVNIQLPLRSSFVLHLLALAVLLSFTAYHTYASFMKPEPLGTDQQNHGIMVAKKLAPELFARDYAFKDSSHFRFYTPFYLRLLEWLTRYTQDYTKTVLIFMPFLVFTYLVGMYFLLLRISDSHWIALVITLVSSSVWPSLGAEVWGVASLQVITPRSFFLALVPWLFNLMLFWVKSGQWWRWGLLAFGVGLATNLHPVSGMGFTELFLSLILIFNRFNRKTLITLFMSIIAIGIGAWPTTINFLQETGSRYGLISFPSFYQVLREQIAAVFFSEWNDLALFGFQIGAAERQTLAWMYFAAMVIWGVVFLLRCLGRLNILSHSTLFLALFMLQIPVALYLTVFQGTLLVTLTLLYWLMRSKAEWPDRIDLFSLTFLALVCIYSFFGSFLINLIWAKFEVWRLTPLVIQQMRMARFIYLPLFIFAARFMESFVYHPSSNKRKRIILILAVIGLLVVAPTSIPWTVLASLLIVVELYGQKYLKDSWWGQLLFDILIRTFIIRVVLFVLLPESRQQYVLLAFALAISYSLFNLWRDRARNSWQIARAGLILSSLPLITLFVLSNNSLLSSWAVDFASIPTSMWTKISPTLLSQTSPERQDELELYYWARTKTEVSSLFYYGSLEFRLLAQRSLTHCQKDIGAGSYKGAPLVEFNDRYEKLQGAYQDLDLLLTYAHQYDVDFIVTTRQQAIVLPLPIAFQNATFLVYHLK